MLTTTNKQHKEPAPKIMDRHTQKTLSQPKMRLSEEMVFGTSQVLAMSKMAPRPRHTCHTRAHHHGWAARTYPCVLECVTASDCELVRRLSQTCQTRNRPLCVPLKARTQIVKRSHPQIIISRGFAHMRVAVLAVIVVAQRVVICAEKVVRTRDSTNEAQLNVFVPTKPPPKFVRVMVHTSGHSGIHGLSQKGVRVPSTYLPSTLSVWWMPKPRADCEPKKLL